MLELRAQHKVSLEDARRRSTAAIQDAEGRYSTVLEQLKAAVQEGRTSDFTHPLGPALVEVAGGDRVRQGAARQDVRPARGHRQLRRAYHV